MSSISIIIPNYNHAVYLPRRIESVLNQTRNDFDLLILDDCSSDGSRDVIMSYANDSRVRVSFNHENTGNPYEQWRRGLAETSGELIWIAESDDFSEPSLLERLAPKLEVDNSVGLAFCESLIVDREDRVIAPYFESWQANQPDNYDLDVLSTEFVMNGSDYVRSFMLPWNTIPNASAVLFRRSALHRIGGPVQSMKLCGDWLTYCKILEKTNVAHVPDFLNYFREHEVNVRSNVRAETIACETRDVIYWAEQTLGPLPSRKRRQLHVFLAQVLLGIERRPTDRRVPFNRMPSALARAFQFSPSILPETVHSLLRQIVGSLIACTSPVTKVSELT